MENGHRSDKGAAFLLALLVAAFAFFGGLVVPKVVSLTDSVVAPTDLSGAATAIEASGIPSTSAALVALLSEDDPALRLSGSTTAGPSSVIPGQAGVFANGAEAVLAIEADGRCYVATITAEKVTDNSGPARPCDA